MKEWLPLLTTLPPPQRAVWPMFRDLPGHFVLYGGTGLALRLDHRQSVDFDFFSSSAFIPKEMHGNVPWLAQSRILQSEPNTLTAEIGLHKVKVSFFGGLAFGRVGQPDRSPDNGVWVASLLDLAATKMQVVQQRAEAKDYLDAAAILRAGISLESALGAAQARISQMISRV